MVLNQWYPSHFPRIDSYRPFIETLVEGLRNEHEADNSRARVRAAVALGLLPMRELVPSNSASHEIDAADRSALQLRQIFTGEILEKIYPRPPGPSPLSTVIQSNGVKETNE